MTREEKAKAYDEALEKAKKALKTDIHESGIWAIQRIFPQLRESEDERIRKEIVSIVQSYRDSCISEGSHKFDDCLAWLEKQKEIPEKEYVFRPLAGTDITIAAEQAIRRANEGDRLVLAFNGWYVPVDKHATTKGLVDSYDTFIEKQKDLDKMIVVTPEVWDNAINEAYENGKKDNEKQKPIIQDVELNDAVYDYVRDHFIAGADFTPEYIKKLMENAFFAGVDYYLLKQESESCESDTNVEKVIEDVIRVYGKTQGEWVGGYDVDTLIINLRRAFNKKDQKPAEWSNEDEKMIGRIRSVVNECASYNDALDVNGDYCEGDYAKLDAWLKSLSSNLKKKNEDVAKLCSNEWNKEDERMLKWIEDILLIADGDLSDKLNGRVSPITDSAYSSMKLCIAKCLSWLKSLPLNLKKKNEDVAKLCSKEWSQEDEDRIRQIERIAQQAGCTQKLQEEIHDWLKSLRPSWKPSEHQMNILKAVKDYVGKGSGYWGEGLGSLIEDLEKLM